MQVRPLERDNVLLATLLAKPSKRERAQGKPWQTRESLCPDVFEQQEQIDTQKCTLRIFLCPLID